MTDNENDWPYEHVGRAEIRCSLTPEECQNLRKELDRLRELERSVEAGTDCTTKGDKVAKDD